MIYSLQQDGLKWAGDALSRGTQSWTREATLDWNGVKLRVHVERDSYDAQSRIYSEVFSPAELKWNRVQSLSGKDHADLPSAYEKDEPRIFSETNALVNEMIAYAQMILEGVNA